MEGRTSQQTWPRSDALPKEGLLWGGEWDVLCPDGVGWHRAHVGLFSDKCRFPREKQGLSTDYKGSLQAGVLREQGTEVCNSETHLENKQVTTVKPCGRAEQTMS